MYLLGTAKPCLLRNSSVPSFPIMIYMYGILLISFAHMVTLALGGPQLSSSTSSLELSGEVYPGYITLTCSKNTTERIFVWYTNDNELARFDEEDATPFTINTRSDLFNATVRVTSVLEVNGYFSFNNFTLTARVSEFLPLQGQNLTCGTLLDRSEPFRVNNFSIALGSPEISSSTSSLELSGEVCPGYITLTCSKNTTERIFVWYTNDNELARFDEEDATPFTIKTRSDLFNATVRVTSVVEVNGYFSFNNFTLTARVSEFLPLQGQNITCGTLLDRSEPFQVNNFSIGSCDSSTSTGNFAAYVAIAVVLVVLVAGLVPLVLVVVFVCVKRRKMTYMQEDILEMSRHPVKNWRRPTKDSKILEVQQKHASVSSRLDMEVRKFTTVRPSKLKEMVNLKEDIEGYSQQKQVDKSEENEDMPALMVVGRPRFGKSRALKEIFEMDSFKSNISPGSVTCVISQVIQKDNEKLIVIDTPGLSAADLNMDDVIPQMKRAVANLRLVLIYVFAINKSIEVGDKEMIEKLHSVFGKNVWLSSIILLTFCDEFEHFGNENEYKHYLKEVASSLEDLLKKCKADFKCIKTVFEIDLDNNENKDGEITAIPVGYKRTSKLLPGLQPKLKWQDLAFSEIIKKVPKDVPSKLSSFDTSNAPAVAVGAGMAALAGAALGAPLGPVGIAVGGALGAVVGGGAGGVIAHKMAN